MSIEEQRRVALTELRELLAEGRRPDQAISEAARESGLREEVVAKIGALLVGEQDKLISARKLTDARGDRIRRADKVVQLYKAALANDPNADCRAIEAAVGIEDFSKDEDGDLFLRTIDVWLTERIKD